MTCVLDFSPATVRAIAARMPFKGCHACGSAEGGCQNDHIVPRELWFAGAFSEIAAIAPVVVEATKEATKDFMRSEANGQLLCRSCHFIKTKADGSAVKAFFERGIPFTASPSATAHFIKPTMIVPENVKALRAKWVASLSRKG
jgi:hypothetical protein